MRPRPAASATTGGSLADAPAGAPTTIAGLPLAVRMRPRTLDEIVGQQHLLAPGSPLRRLAAGRADVGVPLGSARHRQDHDRRRWSPGRPTRSSSRSPRSPPGSRRCGPSSTRPGATYGRPADRAVRRRGAPVLQDPAGRAAAGRREPAGHPDRRHHGEPQLLGHLAAAVPVAAAHPAAADRRRHLRRCWTGRSPTSAGSAGRTRWTTTRGRPAPARRWRRPPGPDLPGGVGGRGRGRGRGDDDQHRHRRAGGRQGGDPLRPRRRPALRRDQRLHQVDPRLRRRRRPCTTWPG